MKPKIKHKLAAVIVAAASLFCLSITASAAWAGNNEGGSGNTSWTIDDTPFGVLTNNDNFAWRADLYVSTSSDGKIKDSDLIGNQLALVGSLLCTSPAFASYQTYIQTNYTNETRDNFNPNGGRLVEDSEGNLTGVQYTIPTLKEFDPADGIYEDASGHKVAIDATDTIKLFSDQWKAPTDFSKVHTRLTGDEGAVYTTKLIEQLRSSDFTKDLLGILKQGSPTIFNDFVSKSQNEGLELSDAFNKYILPNGSEPMVEWALVLTPLYRFEAVVPFYYRNGTAFDNVSDTLVALDSFWIAEYNAASKLLGSRGWYSQTLNRSPVYNGSGMLSRWLVENSGAPAAAAYCTQGKDPYLGVFNNDGNTSQAQWYSLLQTNPANFAKRGGIAVFTTKITTPEAPVYYHTYTYEIDENNPPVGYNVGTAYSQESLLKFIDKLPAATVSVTKGSKSPEGDFYIPATDSEALERGIPVAAMTPNPTTKQPGAQTSYPQSIYPDYYLQKYPSVIPDPEPMQTPLTASQALKTPKATPDNTADDPKEYHVMLIHVDIKPKTAPSVPSEGTDRIKSQDVTQFIEIKPTGNEYLDAFSRYANSDPDNFNRDKFDNGNHNGGTHNHTTCIRITSFDNSATNGSTSIVARNFMNQSETFCSARRSSHRYEVSCDDTCPASHGGTHSTWGHSASCSATWSLHQYASESVEVYYGLSKPSSVQRTRDRNGYIQGLTSSGGWGSSAPSTSHSDFKKYAEVGVVIPESYYAYKDVVKTSASLDYDDPGASKYKGLVYVLPNKDGVTSITAGCHNIQANKNAVFDILMKDSDNYWIQYLSNGKIVGKDVHQSSTFDTKDKDADKQNSTGDGKFDWLSSGATVNGVHFLAHRDLLSADEVSTSLAVSGYMAKYANSSDTFDYLTLMKNAGYTFKGLENLKNITNKSKAYDLKINFSEAGKIGHENRVVWVANAATVNDLKSSITGSHANEYNTNFVGGINNTESPTSRQKCHFGLGGLKSDGADIFSRIGDNNLNNLTLEKNADGDVTRSTYYFATFSSGSNYTCWHHVLSKGGFSSCSCGYSGHNAHPITATHNCIAGHPEITAVSGNHFVAKNADFYKDTMSRNKLWNNKTATAHNGAIEKIEASRLSFEVSLGVEGTTAGQYNGANGEKGIIYQPTDKDGYKVDNYKLALNTFKSHVNVLTLVANSETEEAKSWKENTFEVHQANYQDVGAASVISNSKVVAEYRFSTPTRDFLFNPSYYMLFDDDFKDNNKSVWMLSEQERGINFKDILSVRLTQTGSGSGVSVDKVYTTHVSSEWSTDLADTQCHKETKLPVAKAGNAIKATTEKSGGTVTMYVILQDPEFTSNPVAVTNDNKQIMQSYVSQANNILKQFQAAASSNGEKMTTAAFKNKLSMAMYSNVTNLSSLNSGYRVTETNGFGLLNDKEPFKLTSDAKLAYKVTTGNKGDSADLANWNFYALPGYKVTNASSGSSTDISDTTTAHNRTINLNGSICYVHNLEGATSYQTKVIDELNDRLCMLMVPQDKSHSESLACPSGTTPYLAGAGNFDWYSEDYEGFVVGVFEIDFTMQGKAKSEVEAVNNALATKFSTIYRSESDWQSDFNELATKSGHDLTVYNSRTFSGFNISNFMDEKTKKKITIGPNGEFKLITNQGAKILNNWAGQKFNKQEFANGIYGVGLELANLNISFGSSTANGNKVSAIGGTGKPFSFYYQPTYFNIRGSVYDTAR